MNSNLFMVPRIGHGFRLQWEPAQGCFVLLYPEGMVKLNQSAGEILKRCDGALVQLHHALRVEQHVAGLRRLPLQAEAMADAGDGGGRRSHGYCTPYFRAIASFMAQRMSSLNCSTSSARSCGRACRSARA